MVIGTDCMNLLTKRAPENPSSVKADLIFAILKVFLRAGSLTVSPEHGLYLNCFKMDVECVKGAAVSAHILVV